MNFAVTFKPGVPKDIIDAIDGLLSGIDGVDSTQLSLHSSASSALLVRLSQHVVRRTHAYYIHQHTLTDADRAADGPGGDVTSAEAVLLGISFLEAIQVDSNILALLHQHGYLHHNETPPAAAAAADAAPPAAATAKLSSLAGSSNSTTGSTAVSPLSSITASPASGLPIYPAADIIPAAAAAAGAAATEGAAAAAGNKDSAVVENVRALLGSSNKEQQQQNLVQQQQQQDVQESEFLLPLLLRSGVTSDVQPLHDHVVVEQLKRSTWRSILAPADDFRWYFGNHVGFYLSFLNAMTVWLLAPAVVSLYLSLAVRSSSTGSSTGTTASTATADAVSNPLVPILLVFHLLWSAAGLKLWRRHEAGLNHKWYQTANRSSSSGSSTTVGSSSSRERSLNETPNHGQNHPQDPSLQPVSGHTTATVDRSAVAAAPAGPKDTASATAAAATVIGRLPGDNVALPLAGAAGTDTVFSDRWGGGVPVASLVTPAASGVRREYTGTWTTNPVTHQAELLNPIHNQLLRYLASMAATLLLLLAAAAVLLMCLNVQGYIPPMHGLVYVGRLSRLSLPGAVFAADQGLIMSQVPLMLRVLATTFFATSIYRPAVMLLTSFENHRTVEGYAASLTVKQASLNALFTFIPVTYVGLLGAGAVAARAEIMGFFRVELLRRIAMELLMPWVLYWMSVKRVRRIRSNMVKRGSDLVKTQSNFVTDAAGAVSALVEEITPDSSMDQPIGEDKNAWKLSSATAADTRNVGSQRDDAVSDCCKPSYDIFTDCWELNRDLGYMLLFAAVYPPAAVICLLFNIVKIKQDCLKLLVVYKRPVPAQLRGIGSWKTVLTVQVFLAVITNIFLSGLSTGQLAQLLPSALIPDSVRSTLLAAVAARPALSTAASDIPTGFSALSPDLNPQQRSLLAANLNHSMRPNDADALSGSPVLNIFQDINSGSRLDSGVGSAATGALGMINQYAKSGMSLNDSVWDAAKMCVNNATSGTALFGSQSLQGFSHPGVRGPDQTLIGGYDSMNPYNTAAVSATAGTPFPHGVPGSLAADHLLLLFVLEHLLIIAMLLIVWAIPSEPAVVRDAARQQQLLLTQLLQQQKESSMVADKSTVEQVTVQPTRLHKNPLYADATARPSAAATM